MTRLTFVRALIPELERRADDGELFARLALPGFRAELIWLEKEAQQIHDDETLDEIITSITSERSTRS